MKQAPPVARNFPERGLEWAPYRRAGIQGRHDDIIYLALRL
jgi:hypothetical protein